MYYTLGEASQRLGCAYAVLWRKVSSGRVRGQKMGMQWFIDDTELERLLAERSSKAQLKAAK